MSSKKKRRREGAKAHRPSTAHEPNKATGKRRGRKLGVDTGPDGIVITPANLIPGQVNVITPPPGYPGRALLWPPPPPENPPSASRRGQYTFALYVGRGMGPVAVYIPNIQGFLFADLEEGVLPPGEDYATIFDALKDAINAQIEPTPPEGTGNDNPPPI